MTNMMKAVVMSHTGGPEVLGMRDVPLPWPGGDADVLVRLKCAGLNPADAYFRLYGPYVGNPEGCILGHDGAGVVEEVGEAVTRFAPGDEVCFCYGGVGRAAGTYAQYAVVPENVLAAKPAEVSFVEAAAAPLVVIASWEALYDRADVRQGEYVLIHAGAGGTGHVAVQLARLRDAHVAATVSTAEKAEFVTGLGAERVISYRSEDFVTVAREWTGGRGLDVAFDNVGPEAMQQTFRAMAPYGRVVTLMGTPEDTEDTVAYNQNLTIINVMMLTPMWRGLTARLTEQAAIVRQGLAWMSTGRLKIHVADTYRLEEASLAHATIETGGFIGKLVLTIDH